MIYIYVLKLQHAKWYIGRTENPQFRLENHFMGAASSWTARFPPVSIHELIPGCDVFDEDKYVIKYMSQYGAENVRGGSFAAIDLTPAQLQIITNMINGACDKCYSCGKSGHFARECPAEPRPSAVDNHESESDWLTTDEDELYYCCMWCDAEFATEKECHQHESNAMCSQKKKAKPPRTGACYRCGRTSHYSPDCYASTHIDGYELD